MAYTDQKRNRAVAIGSVVIVHAAIGTALLSGLAVKFERPLITILEGENIPIETPPPVDEPPPPELNAEQPPSAPPVNAPVPVVRTPVTTTVPTTPLIHPTVPYTPPIIEVGPPVEPALLPSSPAVDLTRGARVRGDQGGWFPQDSYPAAARRAGAEGRVSVSVDVGANGRVVACRVVGSSGNEDLDAATCRLATRNGRFEPARDAAGVETGATVTLRPVRWRLEE